MKNFRRDIIIGILFVLAAGTLSHFLYDWSGQRPAVGLFTPVNESVWEHMKLLFFPILLYMLVMCFRHRKIPCMVSAFCAGILAGTFLIPVLFYVYTFLLGRNLFFLDISTFIVSVLLAFWLSYRLTLSCRLAAFTFPLCGLVGILFACFLLFTYHPPALKIFEDPTVKDQTGPIEAVRPNETCCFYHALQESATYSVLPQVAYSCPAIWKYCRSSCPLTSYVTHR